MVTPAHVYTGRCRAGPDYLLAVQRLRDSITSVIRLIESAAGSGSELHALLLQAQAGMHAATPADALATGADAMRRLLACHVPAVDWLHGDEHAARRRFDGRMIAEWTRLLGAAHQVQATWMAASATEIRRRTRLDTMRGLALTVLRAWREVADSVPPNGSIGGHEPAATATAARWRDSCTT